MSVETVVETKKVKTVIKKKMTEVNTKINERLSKMNKLLIDILTHYEIIQDINHARGKDVNVKYVCHSEYDSQVTDFEALSNANKIVLKTTLPDEYLPAIMHIFQAIYDQNFNDFIGDDLFCKNVYYDEDLELDEEVLKRMKDFDFGEWIKTYEIYGNSFINDDEDDEDKDKTKNIGNEMIYSKVPRVKNIYKHTEYYSLVSNAEQKIYELSDIINLIIINLM